MFGTIKIEISVYQKHSDTVLVEILFIFTAK